MKLLSLLIAALFMMGCNAMDSADQSLNVVGEWRIVHIGERPVIENSAATISFEQDGRFGGNASCNRYFGSYTLEGSGLKIGEHMGATRMMCAEQALMEQEDRIQVADFLINTDCWTLIAASNDPLFAARFDHLLIMDQGTIVDEGTYDELSQKPYASRVFNC